MVDEILNQVEEVTDVPVSDILKDIRVLFADSSTNTLYKFQQCVHKLGWAGLYVNNAVEIMNVANNILGEGLTLDAVVLNIDFISNGPKLTGITAAREIRKAMPDVPIVFISAYVTSIIREEVRRVGAEIIQKPLDLEVLFVRLSQLIYWHRLATMQSYDGPDRRRNSINRSKHFRRATDYILSTPDRIAQTLRELNGEGD